MSAMELFNLLPGFHRARDAEHGDPLKVLLGVLETELAALRANIGLLYDSWFIDTCPDWAVPYIADLVGLDEALTGTDSPGLRALVANTIGYQRARGTLATVGHVATAVSGWPVLAEDLDARMIRSHGFGGPAGGSASTLRISGKGRPAGPAVPGLRGAGARVRQAGGPPHPHPVGVGLLVWRLQSHALGFVQSRALGQGRYSIHPMGVDAPLFTAPRRLPLTGRAPDLAAMPQPLTRIMLASLLVEQDAVPVTLRVKQDGQWSAVPADAITVADLRTWPAGAPPDGARVLLDPELGRMVLAGTREAVAVDHASGAAWAIGGGGYGRADRLVLPDPTTWIARIGGDMKVPPERREDGRHCFASLVEALGACPGWATDVLIEIADNRIHLLTAPEGDSRVRGVLDGSAPDSLVLLCGGRHVVLQAMDGFRPCIDGSLILDTRDKPGGLVVSGVWWRGGLTLRGEATLMLVDSTVWPQDGPAVTSDPQAAGQQSVLVAHSITGALRLRALSSTLRISASIVDGRGAAAVAGNATGGGAFGPAPALDCATLIGDLVTSAMPDGGDSLVTGAIVTRQGRTPPPAMVSFRSRRFGHPAYAVLADDCPAAISRGASDGGELGAFHVCQNRSRIECLARVIDDYLPEGLSGQFHFVT